MHLLEQGGPAMWPLLLLSVFTLAVIVERLIAYGSMGLPDAARAAALARAARKTNPSPPDPAELCRNVPAVRPMVAVLLGPGSEADRERAALVVIEDVLQALDRRLVVLAFTIRAAPLLGLLGTVLGMIQTFSNLADLQGAVDMSGLAAGIWQALLTTAAGLMLALPALLAHQWLRRRQERAGFAMRRLANALLTGVDVPGPELSGQDSSGQDFSGTDAAS